MQVSLVAPADLGGGALSQWVQNVREGMDRYEAKINETDDPRVVGKLMDDLNLLDGAMKAQKLKELIVEASILHGKARRRLFKLLPAMPPEEAKLAQNKEKHEMMKQTISELGMSYHQLAKGRELWSPGDKQSVKLTDDEIEAVFDDCRETGRAFTDNLLRDRLRLKRKEAAPVIDTAPIIDPFPAEEEIPPEEEELPPEEPQPVATARPVRNEEIVSGEMIQAVRSVMGGIDFDPTSSDEAQEVVAATTYCTVENNSLDDEIVWGGNIWLFPPSDAEGYHELFMDKLQISNYKQAIVRLPVECGSHNFHRWLGNANACCFLHDSPEVVMAFRVHEGDFEEEFNGFGNVLVPLA